MKVSGPAMPSGASAFFVCHALRAFAVFAPNSPSASTPSLACSRLTGSPDVPCLSIAMDRSSVDLCHVAVASRQPGGFLLGWQPPLGRQMVDHARKVFTQRGKQLVAFHACLLHKISDPLLAQSGL